MNTISIHERPGVYSAYEASTLVSGLPGGAVVGIAALSSGGSPGKLHILNGTEDAVTRFGEADPLTALVRLLFQNGASSVLAVPVDAPEQYPAAFLALNNEERVKIIVCDGTDISIQQKLRDQVEEVSEMRRERIAVVCGGAGETVNQLVERAANLNSERVVLAAPGETETQSGAALAAAVAGAIAAEPDPAVPLGGAVLKGVTGVSQQYNEASIDTLVRGGVTVLESVGGQVSVIRGVSTRTTTGGATDSTWRELSTVLIVDDVIPTLRNSLRARFTRAKNTQQVRNAIRSQVILELEEKKNREIITGYGNVTVSPMADNPTVCLVKFSFAVAHALNQIWLKANITV